MAMPNVSLTGIEFTIKGSADKASASVDSLIQKLSKLNESLSSADNAKSFANSLKKIASAADSLSSANMEKVKSALEKLSSSIEPFKGVGDSLKGVATFGTAMSKLADKPDNLMQVAEILAKIATIDFTNIKEAGDGLRNIAMAANSLAKIPKATKETGDAAKKANSPLKTFLKSLGRIAFYRILRGILKSITQAFQEGLKNAYQFDKIAGGQLAQSLDRLATTSLTMKNQLGAAFGQLLVALTPVIVGAIKLITALASAITRLIAILGGSSQWLRAKEVWTEWGDAAEGAGGAAKEALKYLAPFDELNVLPSQRSGGGGGGGDNYGDMFEWVDTDVGADFLETLKQSFQDVANWFESKDWQEIGEKAWDKLKEVFSDDGKATECVNAFFEAVGAAFGALAGTFAGMITAAITDYDGDGIDLGDVLTALWKGTGDILKWIDDNVIDPLHDGFVEAFGENGEIGWTVTLSLAIGALVIKDLIAGGAAAALTGKIAAALAGTEAASVTAGATAFSWVIAGVASLAIAFSVVWSHSTEEEKQNFIDTMQEAIDNFRNAWTQEGFEQELADIYAVDDIIVPIKAKVDEVVDALPPEHHQMEFTARVGPIVLPPDMSIEGFNAIVTKFTDSISTDKKKLGSFIVNVASYIDGITKGKTLNNFVAWITGRWNKIPDKDRYLTNFTAWLTGRWNKIPQNERYLDKFTAWITGRYNKIPTSERTLNKFVAWITKGTNNIPEKDRTLSGFIAKLFGYELDVKDEDKKLPDFTASVTKVGTTLLKDSQRKIDSFTAVIKYQQDGMKKTEKILKDYTANINGATNNIPTDQLSLVSTALISGRLIKTSLQDPNNPGNLQLDATAHISRITGQTTVPILYDNGVAGGMSASGGGVRYSIESGDNEEVLYRAMSRALADSELGGDIELDGEVLYKRMVNRNRANTRLTGVNAMA